MCIKTGGSSLGGGAVEAVVRGLADEVDAEGDDGKQRVPALNLVTIALNISSSPAPSKKKR